MKFPCRRFLFCLIREEGKREDTAKPASSHNKPVISNLKKNEHGGDRKEAYERGKAAGVEESGDGGGVRGWRKFWPG